MPPLYDESNSSANNSDEDFCVAASNVPSPSSNLTRAGAIAVPTFSPCTSTSTNKNERDSFLHYSNDEVRIRTLMMSEEGDSNSSSSAEAEENVVRPPAQPLERKTRISFELHPSLILDDMLLNDEQFASSIDGSGRSDSDTTLDDLLQELMQIEDEDEMVGEEDRRAMLNKLLEQ
jgi:hypothetical protein